MSKLYQLPTYRIAVESNSLGKVVTITAKNNISGRSYCAKCVQLKYINCETIDVAFRGTSRAIDYRTCEEEGKLIVSIDVSLEYLPPIREQIVMMSFENKESSFDLIEIKEEIKKNEAVVDQIANRKLIHYEFNGVNGNHFYTSDVLEKGKYLLELSGCIIDPNYGCYDQCYDQLRQNLGNLGQITLRVIFADETITNLKLQAYIGSYEYPFQATRVITNPVQDKIKIGLQYNNGSVTFNIVHIQMQRVTG